MKFIAFIKSNSLILLIIAVLTYSIFAPQAGLFVSKAGLMTYLTFIAMFAAGLGLSLANIKDGFKDFKSILYSFFSIYLIFPLIAYVILLVLGIRSGDLYIGGMIVAAQASTLVSAVVLTATANGNVSLALIITIINSTASAVLTPLILKIMLASDQSISIDVGPMMLKLLLVLVLPVVLAQVVRKFIGKHIEKITPYRKAVSKVVVLTIVLSGAAAASSQIKENLGQAALIILVVAALHCIMLALAYLYIHIAKVKLESKSAVLFTASQKTLPASLLIWQTYFSAYLLAPIVMVLHHIVQLTIDSFVAGRLVKSSKRDDDAEKE